MPGVLGSGRNGGWGGGREGKDGGQKSPEGKREESKRVRGIGISRRDSKTYKLNKFTLKQVATFTWYSDDMFHYTFKS